MSTTSCTGNYGSFGKTPARYPCQILARATEAAARNLEKSATALSPENDAITDNSIARIVEIAKEIASDKKAPLFPPENKHGSLSPSKEQALITLWKFSCITAWAAEMTHKSRAALHEAYTELYYRVLDACYPELDYSADPQANNNAQSKLSPKEKEICLNNLLKLYVKNPE